MAKADGPGAELSNLQGETADCRKAMRKLEVKLDVPNVFGGKRISGLELCFLFPAIRVFLDDPLCDGPAWEKRFRKFMKNITGVEYAKC